MAKELEPGVTKRKGISSLWVVAITLGAALLIPPVLYGFGDLYFHSKIGCQFGPGGSVMINAAAMVNGTGNYNTPCWKANDRENEVLTWLYTKPQKPDLGPDLEKGRPFYWVRGLLH